MAKNSRLSAQSSGRKRPLEWAEQRASIQPKERPAKRPEELRRQLLLPLVSLNL
jgi:hypothetical protein